MEQVNPREDADFEVCENRSFREAHGTQPAPPERSPELPAAVVAGQSICRCCQPFPPRVVLSKVLDPLLFHYVHAGAVALSTSRTSQFKLAPAGKEFRMPFLRELLPTLLFDSL